MQSVIPKFVLSATLVACGLLYLITVPSLPDVIASLFGSDGQARSYMTRDFYLPYIFVFGIGLPLFLAFMISVLPTMIQSRSQVPAMSEAQARIVGTFGWWYASFTALFAAAVHVSLISANQADPPRLQNGPFLALLVGFLGVTLVWTLIILKKAKAAA